MRYGRDRVSIIAYTECLWGRDFIRKSDIVIQQLPLQNFLHKISKIGETLRQLKVRDSDPAVAFTKF